MDTDGNGKIDFEEFLQSMAEKREMHDSIEDLRMVDTTSLCKKL